MHAHGVSAFDVVNREIQKRELYCSAGEEGDYWRASAAELEDTLTKILGVWIGPINSTVSCVADDVLCLSDTQTKLQCQLDIASHYGKKWRVKYSTSKTKVTVTGSSAD